LRTDKCGIELSNRPRPTQKKKNKKKKNKKKEEEEEDMHAARSLRNPLTAYRSTSPTNGTKYYRLYCQILIFHTGV